MGQCLHAKEVFRHFGSFNTVPQKWRASGSKAPGTSFATSQRSGLGQPVSTCDLVELDEMLLSALSTWTP